MFYSTSVELASVDLASFNEQATKRDIRVIFVNIYTKFILGLGLNPHLPNSFWADTNAEKMSPLEHHFYQLGSACHEDCNGGWCEGKKRPMVSRWRRISDTRKLPGEATRKARVAVDQSRSTAVVPFFNSALPTQTSAWFFDSDRHHFVVPFGRIKSRIGDFLVDPALCRSSACSWRWRPRPCFFV
jgi:hypothetical protein